jgi:hypothetical protein
MPDNVDALVFLSCVAVMFRLAAVAYRWLNRRAARRRT